MQSLLDIVDKLSAARNAIEASFQSDDRPWSRTVLSFAHFAFEHADRALDAAIVVALGSGVTLEELETATGQTVLRPDWFD